MGGTCSTDMNVRNAYMILVRKHQGKKLLVSICVGGKAMLTVVHRDVDWIQLA
jgi:hypothetical protein